MASQASAAPNVIILTSGLSGSSVLAGLIGQSGRWLGDSTFKKEYDTYENSELVRLNLAIMDAVGYTGTYTREFSPELIERITALKDTIDLTPYREFVARCQERGPWAWKDPRLWLTIRFWAPLLPLEDCRFLVLTRDLMQAWVAGTLRRRIRSFHSLETYENAILDSILDFVRAGNLPYLRVKYEDIVGNPDVAITELNGFLGTHLTVDSLKAIYRGELYKVPKSSLKDYVKACLIYLKNYSQREDYRVRQPAK